MGFDRVSDLLLAWFADNVLESSMPKHVQETTVLDRQVAVESKWPVTDRGNNAMDLSACSDDNAEGGRDDDRSRRPRRRSRSRSGSRERSKKKCVHMSATLVLLQRCV